MSSGRIADYSLRKMFPNTEGKVKFFSQKRSITVKRKYTSCGDRPQRLPPSRNTFPKIITGINKIILHNRKKILNTQKIYVFKLPRIVGGGVNNEHGQRIARVAC